MILFALLVSTVVTAQASGPGLFGPTAQHLTQDDVTQITALFRDTGAPWLLYGASQGWMPGWYVGVYFTPDHVSGRVRRGRLASSTTTRATRGDYSGGHVWQVLSNRSERYAQVTVPDTDPTTLTATRDLNRPFRVVGEFSDDDLIAMVDLIRTSPQVVTVPDGPMPASPTVVRGTWPIESIISRAADQSEVRLLDDGPSERSGQLVILARLNGRFLVKVISEWEAD